MKPLFHLVWIRLTEQPAKMLYLAATLAALILAWIVFSAFASPSLLSNSKAIKSELGLFNGRAQNTPFPAHYIPRIQQMPGVDDIRWFTMAAFFCADGSGTTVTVTARDGDHDDEFRAHGVSETDLEIWHNTENGVLVGAETAKKCGLTQGTTIAPNNIFGNGELPLHVVAVLPKQGGFNDFGVNAHYYYINRFLDGNIGSTFRDAVVRAIINVKNPVDINKIAQTIEQTFQFSDPPLEVTVLGDSNSLLGRYGQVQALLLLIVGAMALCVLLVFVAITTHLIAQRRASMAILQTLGFSRRIQFFGLLLEFASILIIGTALGVTSGYGVLALLTPWAADTLLSGAMHPIDGAILILFPALLLLLASTLIWPAMQMAKLKPVDYLRF